MPKSGCFPPIPPPTTSKKPSFRSPAPLRAGTFFAPFSGSLQPAGIRRSRRRTASGDPPPDCVRRPAPLWGRGLGVPQAERPRLRRPLPHQASPFSAPALRKNSLKSLPIPPQNFSHRFFRQSPRFRLLSPVKPLLFGAFSPRARWARIRARAPVRYAFSPPFSCRPPCRKFFNLAPSNLHPVH